jgi:hypothetical protein
MMRMGRSQPSIVIDVQVLVTHAPRLAMMFYLLGDRDCWQRLPILRRLTR